MALGSLANQFDNRLAHAFRGSSVLQQSYPVTGYKFFTPLDLFNNGEQGVWYDPSDLTTMFEDSTGYTAVHTPGNGSADSPVGLLLDKRLGGIGANGAARYNYNTYTDTLTNAAWSLTGAGATITAGFSAPDGSSTAYKLYYPGGGGGTQFYQSLGSASPISKDITESIWMRADSTVSMNYGYFDNGTSDVSTVTVTTTWTKFSKARATGFSGTGDSRSHWLYPPSVSTTVYIWHPDLRLTSQVALTPTYQPITSDWAATMPGNHATQTTSTKRPTLSARYNLLTYTEQFDNAAWTKSSLNAFGSGSVANTTATTDPLGTNTADFIQENSDLAVHGLYYGTAQSSGSWTFSCAIKSAGRNYALIRFIQAANSFAYSVCDLSNGTIVKSATISGAAITSSTSSITSLGNGWYRFTVTASSASNFAYGPGISSCTTANPTVDAYGAESYLGNGTSGLYIWGADLRVSNDGVGLPAYQRVVDANTYDSVGFPYYLLGDGVDDYLGVASFNLPLINRMQAVGFCQTPSFSAANSAIWTVYTTGKYDYNQPDAFTVDLPSGKSFQIESSQPLSYNLQDSIAPGIALRSVYSENKSPGIGILNKNGTQVSTDITFTENSATNSGGLVLFARYLTTIDASAGLRGRIYALIIRGAASTAVQVSNTEAWINGKIKAY